jgi:hypothetical protein
VRFDTVIAALAGAVLGGLASFVAQAISDQSRERARAREAAAMLRVELLRGITRLHRPARRDLDRVKILARASPEESAEHAKYLMEKTCVPWYGELLRDGKAVAWHAELGSREELGSTSTIFKNLGNIYASTEVGRRRFLVKEAFGVWQRARALDPVKFARLESLVAAEGDGSLVDRRITLAVTLGGTMVVDGNKRSIAIHHVGRTVVLPIYLLKAPPGQPPLQEPA